MSILFSFNKFKKIPLFVGFYTVPRTVSVETFSYVNTAVLIYLFVIATIISFIMTYKRKSTRWFLCSLIIVGALLFFIMVNNMLQVTPIVYY